MEENLKPSLTKSDIQAQEKAKLTEEAAKLGLPEGLAEAIAEQELLMATKATLRRVPEFTFKRDILPAIVGTLGQVDMRWWIKQFGSVTVGFLVVKDTNHSEILFEFPPMAPSNHAEKNDEKRPVGEVIQEYHNRASIRPAEAVHEFKQKIREFIQPGDHMDFIENIAKVERICRYYGETILTEAKPELKAIINEAIEGLNDALGKLGDTVTVIEEAVVKKTDSRGEDDDGEASPELYD